MNKFIILCNIICHYSDVNECIFFYSHYVIVTVARAVELKHNANLISALANETSKLFLDAANTLRPFKAEISAQWIKYLELKAAFYQSYVNKLLKNINMKKYKFLTQLNFIGL